MHPFQSQKEVVASLGLLPEMLSAFLHILLYPHIIYLTRINLLEHMSSGRVAGLDHSTFSSSTLLANAKLSSKLMYHLNSNCQMFHFYQSGRCIMVIQVILICISLFTNKTE